MDSNRSRSAVPSSSIRSSSVRIASRPTTAVRVTRSAAEARLLAEVLNGLYDAILICDAEDRVCEVNQRAVNFLLYSREEMMGMKVDRFFAGFNEAVLRRIHAHVSNSRFAMIDVVCLRKDGTRFPAETAVSGMTLFEQPVLMFAVRNLERRMRADPAARNRAHRRTTSPLVITDTAACVKHANVAFLTLFGFQSMEDVTGRDVRSFWLDSAAAEALMAYPKSGKTWEGELSFKNDEGHTFFVRASAAPTLDPRHRVVGMVFTFVDITEQKKTDEERRREVAAKMDEMMSQSAFSGNLATLSFADVVQLIFSAEKTGTMTVMGDRRSLLGRIGFDEGNVTAIAYNDLTGADAFYGIMMNPDAREFVFDAGEVMEADPALRVSTMNLLMEGVRRMDEAAETSVTE